jgi:hypothetical protein
MTQGEFLLQIAQWLEAAGIPFMLTGSHSSTHYGQARPTQDVDVVIDPTPEQLERFLNLVGDRYYLSADAARDALRRRTMFNIIDFADGWKADLILRKDRPYSVVEFTRRQPAMLHGRLLPLASPEDVILSKLEWDKITPSERQRQDALSVAAVQWERLDQGYLRQWAQALDVTDRLEELLREAAKLQVPPGPKAS